MNDILICSWSGILVLGLLVAYKYRCTRPHLLWPAPLCLPAGVGAAVCAFIASAYLCRASAVSPDAPGLLPRAAGFIISAGFGEEFFKLAGGLLVIVVPGAGRAAMRDADRYLCMVTVALVFAVTENAWRLGDLGSWAVGTSRGLLCIPMHMALGGLLGSAVNEAYRTRRASPLAKGYLLAACLHADYDVLLAVVRSLLPAMLLIAGVVWLAWREWAPIQEWDGLPLEPGQEDPAVSLSRRGERIGRLHARAILRARLFRAMRL